MKRSLKHGGSVALRVGAALGMTTVGVVAIGAAPAYATPTPSAAPAVTGLSYSLGLGTLTISLNEEASFFAGGTVQIISSGTPVEGSSVHPLEFNFNGTVTASVPSLSAGDYVDVLADSFHNGSFGNPLWLYTGTSFSPVSLSTFSAQSTPTFPAQPASYSLDATNDTANAVLSFDGPEKAYIDQNTGASLENFSASAINDKGEVVSTVSTISPNSSGLYTANFTGLIPGARYHYIVTAYYLPSSTVNPDSAPLPLTAVYKGTVPSASSLTPALPQVQGLNATPSYAGQGTFANPQETVSWDSVAAETIDNETYTPKNYVLQYTPDGGTPTTVDVPLDASPSASFDVVQGTGYNYSVSVVWSSTSTSGTFTGDPQTGSFMANSSLGVPVLTSFSSSEQASTLELSGSFNTPAAPASGAAGITAQYQVQLSDGTKTYDVSAPETIGFGTTGVPFAVSSSDKFAFQVGDAITAQVVVNYFDNGSQIGTSTSTPATITVTNPVSLTGPTNVVFANTQALGGTVSWTGPTTADAPAGYTLNGYTVEIEDGSGPGDVVWTDNLIGASATSNAYNVTVPADVAGGFLSNQTYTAVVYANYTNTAESSLVEVPGSASASMVTVHRSLLQLRAPSLTQSYANGAPALQVSWDAAPSIELPDASSQIPVSSYTLIYAPLAAFANSFSLNDVQYIHTVLGITPASDGGPTSYTLTGLEPNQEYGVIVLARYALPGLSSGTFIGASTLPDIATTYQALPTPSLSTPSFTSTGGSLEMQVSASTPHASNPNGLSATYSFKATNEATGQTHTFGPYSSDLSTLPETFQSSAKTLLFGLGEEVSVQVVAHYSLDGSSVGSVVSTPEMATVPDSALELPGVSSISAYPVADQNGNDTIASINFVAPTGSTSSGWSVAGYDIVGTGTNGQTDWNAFFPASGSGSSSNVLDSACTAGNCSALIDGLTSGYTYNLTVIPVYQHVGGSEVHGASASMASSLQMSNGLSAGVSHIVMAPGSSISNPSLVATWEPPAPGSTDGLAVQGYSVQLYRVSGSSNVPVGAPEMVTGSKATFNGLSEQDTYLVGITMLYKNPADNNPAGGVIYGATVYSTTTPESQNEATVPVENVALSANDSQSGVLDASWSVQSGDGYTLPASFVIGLTADGSSVPSITVAASAVQSSSSQGVTNYTYAIQGLTPGLAYVATVTPYSGVGGTGSAGMSGSSQAAVPYSTYVSNASVTNPSAGSVTVHFTGAGSTQYQVAINDAFGDLVSGAVQATQSAGTNEYTATFTNIPQADLGYPLHAEVTPVISSGEDGPTDMIPFTAYGNPNPVGNLQVTGSGATAVSLGWSAPTTGLRASGSVSYQVSWWSGGTKIGSAETSNTDYTVEGLNPGTNYTFDVVAVNQQGFESTVSTVTAAPASNQVAGPVNLDVQPMNGGLHISWGAPVELGGNSLTGQYEVTVINEKTGATIHELTANTYYVPSGLTNGDSYEVSVAAQLQNPNSGDTFWSSASSYGPAVPEGVNAPTGLLAYVSGGQVLVTWNGVQGATDYQVNINGNGWVSTHDSTTHAFAATAGSEYQIEVRATNGLEYSAPAEVSEFVSSGPVMPTIAEQAPVLVGSASKPLLKSPSTTSDVTVNFTAPTTIGSGAVTSYTVSLYSLGDGTNGLQLIKTVTLPISQVLQGLNGELYTYTFDGVANGQTVEANVAANTATESASSQTVALPVVGVIPAPANVQAKAKARGSLTLSFGAPANLNGGAPTGVEVYWQGSSGQLHSKSVSSSSLADNNGAYSYDLMGLNDGETYTVWVAWVNQSNQIGEAGQAASSATTFGVPGTVPVTSVTTGSKEFSFDWTAPLSDGGEQITGYTVKVAGDGTTLLALEGADTTSASFPGLTNGDQYTVSIYATNDIGSGASTTFMVTPESKAPVVNSLVVTATPGDASVRLSIPAATAGNGSSPITGYEYQYGPTNGGFDSGWIQVPSTETDTNPILTTVDGLTNGVEYSFQVRALSGTVATPYPTVDATPSAPATTGGGGGSVAPLTRVITVVEPSPSTSPSVVTQVSSVSSTGYALIGADGGYFNHAAPFDNSLPGEGISTGAIVGGAPAGTGGYWMVSSTGRVYDFGSAASLGSVSNISGTVVGMASTPGGGGYWIATNTGNVYAFGNAGRFGGVSKYGITGLTGSRPLNAPIVGIAALPDGSGYYLVAADGGVFNFGSAQLYGSTYSLGLTGLTGSRPLNAPIVGMAVDPEGTGYVLVGADGGVFNLGSAQNQGSTYSYGITGLTGAHPLNKPIVGVAYAPTVGGKQGYYLFAADGGVFNFGSAAYHGSDADVHLDKPIVGGFVF